MKLHKILRSNLGFSMVEVSVAMGLLGLASLAVMNLADNVTTSSRRAETILSKSQFASALGTYIQSARACNEMKGTLPAFNTGKTSIQFQDWKVLGVKENPTTPGGIYPGKEFKNFRIKSLTGSMDLAAANLGTVRISGVDYKKAFLNIEMIIETTHDLKKTVDGTSVGKRDNAYTFNVPVIADNTGKVRFCAEEKNMQEACTTMGGTFSGGQCVMNKSCKLQGTYRILTCTPHTCSLAEGPTVGNPMAGGAVGCPSGMGVQTGYKEWPSTAPCSGKKCTPIPVTNRMSWYSCLDCGV